MPSVKRSTVTIDQKQTVDDEQPPYRFDVDLGLCADVPGTSRRECRTRACCRSSDAFASHVERAHETVTVPLDFEPKLVRFDPGAWLLGSITYKLGATFAAATLHGDPDPVARIRAARELAKDGSQTAQEALRSAFERDPFWGVSTKRRCSGRDARAVGSRDTGCRDCVTRIRRFAGPSRRRSGISRRDCRETLLLAACAR